MATTPGRNLRRFQLGKKHYISLIAGYILLKNLGRKSVVKRIKGKGQESSLGLFYFKKEASKQWSVLRPTNNGFTTKQRKARHQRLGFLRLGERGVFTPKEFQFNGHSLALNYSD
ncbi:hypothetical protein LEP1GSC087_0176 [Leptospira interrogans serovar Bataviae str. L1111]|uniref:hypothetical protein n=1 Tax=Leptospira interrogans TaxID=173 RepID=UPI00029859C1|nr:hypothetical protein [Leptospira interrogans]EKR27376.1 hypothetical protein LEP1GSC087_0176 [Leptospira interrogans serovar Bataviae str. L1111]